MKVSLNKIGRAFGLLLLFALCAGVASARQATGSLRGQLADEFGGVIVGGSVTVTDAAGKAKTVASDNDGNFTLAGLAPGKYTVRAIAPGFALYENAEVEVGNGRNELGKITLGVSLEKEEVTVASEGPINVEGSSAGAIVLKGKDLEALPDDPDDLAAALSALAGPSAGPNGGQITIDGFEGGRIPSKDSIREIRINDNPLSAERDQPGFGGIQILTKPGTDKLRGTVYGTFNDESLNARNPVLRSEKRPPFQFRQFGGSLSGTIVPKRLSFFFDIERGETDDNDIINATILDPLTLTPLGFNTAVLTPTRRFNMSPRFDYAINNNHTLVARYSYFRNSLDNQGVSQFSLPERAYDVATHSHQLQLTETAVLNKTTVNETRFQFIRNRNEQTALNTGVATNVLESFFSGGASVGDSFNESTRWELTNSTTWAHGLHSVKYGARVRGIHLSDFSEGNFNGTFTFGGSRGVLDSLTSLERYRRTQELLRAGGTPAQLAAAGLGPTQLSLVGGEPLADISQVDFGGFVQDDWKVRPNLTLGAGLRYEAQTNIGSKYNFAPRVYLAWSPDTTPQKQGKTAIRLGFGIFYDRVSESMSLQALRFNGVNQQQFIISAPFADDTSARAQQARAILSLYPILPTVEQLSTFAVPQTTRQLASDIQAPYSYISGFILTRQLSKTLTLNVFASTYSTRHLLRSRSINAPLSTTGLRPRPELGDIYQFETSGTQNMKQLNIGVNKQISRAFSIFANYTYGRAFSDADFGGFPVNQYDVSGEYGRSFFDTRHRVFIGGSMGVPFLKLSLNPIIIANTGRPFNITTGFDNNRDSIFNDRPAFADAQTASADLRHTQWGDFDINPKAGQTIIPRNYAEGPGFFSVNLRVGRAISFGDTAASRAAAD
ncbi:MAG: carboxypeptidase regulatory-like domain-containing protein, partial [Pyrinomonadaceae bacterium]